MTVRLMSNDCPMTVRWPFDDRPMTDQWPSDNRPMTVRWLSHDHLMTGLSDDWIIWWLDYLMTGLSDDWTIWWLSNDCYFPVRWLDFPMTVQWQPDDWLMTAQWLLTVQNLTTWNCINYIYQTSYQHQEIKTILHFCLAIHWICKEYMLQLNKVYGQQHKLCHKLLRP